MKPITHNGGYFIVINLREDDSFQMCGGFPFIQGDNATGVSSPVANITAFIG